MRINKDHPLFFRGEALLNGVKQQYCFEADTTEGWVVRAHLRDGRMLYTKLVEEMPPGCFDWNGVVAEQVAGKVEILVDGKLYKEGE